MNLTKRALCNKWLTKEASSANHFKAKQLVLSETPEFSAEALLISRCCSRNRCNKPACKTCAQDIPDIVSRKPLANDVYDIEKLRYDAKKASRNYRIRGGRWLLDPFISLPKEMVYPITINFSSVSLHSDMNEAADLCRKYLQRKLQQHYPDSMLRGRMDISPVWLDQFGSDYRGTELDALFESYKHQTESSRVSFNLHMHGLIFSPMVDNLCSNFY